MAASLTAGDRETIFVELVRDRGVAWSVVADKVGCHRTTVSREVSRNGGRDSYSPLAAQTRREELSRRRRPPKLSDPVLAERVVDDLVAGFSPAATARRLAAEGTMISHETIYRAVYDGTIQVDPRVCLRSGRARRRRRKRDLTTNPTGNYLGDYRPISTRPAHVDERVRVGNWEGDLITGAGAHTHMITLYERVCRLTHLIALPHGKASRHVVAALGDWFGTLPPRQRLTLTWDRGSELAHWSNIDGLFADGIYFADKHSPWQRGGNEQNNRLIRFWFPRAHTLADPTGQRIQKALHILNNQPRRSLGWLTPNQAYHQHTVQ